MQDCTNERERERERKTKSEGIGRGPIDETIMIALFLSFLVASGLGKLCFAHE